MPAGIRYCLNNHPYISVLLHRMGSEALKYVLWSECLTLLRFMVQLEDPFSLSLIFYSTLNKARQVVDTVLCYPAVFSYLCSIFKINAYILSVIIKLFFSALNLLI